MMFAALPHISVKADEVFSIAGLPITNANLVGILGLVLLVWLMFRTRAAVLGRKKSNFATHLTLWCIEGLYKTVGQVIPNQKWARRVAPLVMTMFFFIAGQYWLGLLPIVGPITVGHTPLFRGQDADLNMTFALATVTIVMAQVYAARELGFVGNLKRYFVNPLRDPIMSFVGILELVAEFSRLLSLSFRLFGNVLAGEILIAMIAYLAQVAMPAVLQPFYIFELFIGGIQAYIFFMLSTVFISLGLAHHGGDEEKQTHDDPSTSSGMKLTAEGVK